MKAIMSSKLISDTREEEIITAFRTLHSKVLNALQECDIAAQFNKEFSKCNTEDIKNLHQQSRALISAKAKAKKEARVADVREKIQVVVNKYMSEARTAKAALESLPDNVRKFLPTFSSTVKIPLTDIRACFPSNENNTQVLSDLEYLGYKVTDLANSGIVIVPFKSEDVEVEIKAA